MRKKVVGGKDGGHTTLAAVLASLGLTRKPDFSDWMNDEDHRIHWAIRILQQTGFGPATKYSYHRYNCGPFSESLETALESMDWDSAASLGEIKDERLAIVRDAISKGDSFLEVLAILLEVVDHNKGISKEDALWMVGRRRPGREAEVESAYVFAEARIWPK